MQEVSFLKILTLNCREATALLSAAEDGRLDLTARFALRLHLVICKPCRAFGRQLRGLRKLTGRLVDRLETGEDVPGPRLSEEARARLQQSIEDAQPPGSSPSS
jgi:hypothetical protein